MMMDIVKWMKDRRTFYIITVFKVQYTKFQYGYIKVDQLVVGTNTSSLFWGFLKRVTEFPPRYKLYCKKLTTTAYSLRNRVTRNQWNTKQFTKFEPPFLGRRWWAKYKCRRAWSYTTKLQARMLLVNAMSKVRGKLSACLLKWYAI